MKPTINRPRKWEAILGFFALILLLFLVNINAKRWFFRIDLTEEKRYSISDASQEVLEKLDGQVYIEVYLDGELSSSYKRLQSTVKETLEELQVQTDHIDFNFVNPADQPSEMAQQRFFKSLIDKGIQPTTDFEMVDGQKVQRMIFPAAMISYKGKSAPILLLKGNKGVSSEDQMISESIEGVEYELINGIKKITSTKKRSIAIIEGHNELGEEELFEFNQSLEEYYHVDRVRIGNEPLESYDAIVIAQPKKQFSDKDKYYIDQYVMQGGNALFFLDMIQMTLDSISMGGTYAFPYQLEIEDLLLHYGAKVNANLVTDITKPGVINLNVGNLGNKARVEPKPWPYYGLINNYAKHPITKNMDASYFKFFSSVDTSGIALKGIKKTPLMFTSKYSHIRPMPSMVSLEQLKYGLLDPKTYKTKNIPVALLSEGMFKSFYATRFPPRGIDKSNQIKQATKKGNVLVVMDGDFIKNDFDELTKKRMPMGYDASRRHVFSNKEFVLNVLSYMTDESGLINTKAKEIKLRPLDEVRIRAEKLKWQLINILIPALLIILFGIIWFILRKKRNEK